MRIGFHEVVGMQIRHAVKLTAFYMLIISVFFLGTILGNHAVTVMSENLPISGRRRIVIDPGHGGEDGGAVSYNGKLESGYNLEISLRLRELLRLIGYDVIMTRTEDTSIYTTGTTIAQKKASDIKERVRIANSDGNMLLLSIHQNYFQESKYSGAQVFYSGNEKNRALAQSLQNQLVDILNPGSSRKEKRGEGIYLLEHVHNPAVLIECGFLSNPVEESKLSDPEYQKKIVGITAAVVAEYLRNT